MNKSILNKIAFLVLSAILFSNSTTSIAGGESTDIAQLAKPLFLVKIAISGWRSQDQNNYSLYYCRMAGFSGVDEEKTVTANQLPLIDQFMGITPDRERPYLIGSGQLKRPTYFTKLKCKGKRDELVGGVFDAYLRLLKRNSNDQMKVRVLTKLVAPMLAKKRSTGSSSSPSEKDPRVAQGQSLKLSSHTPTQSLDSSQMTSSGSAR